MFSTITLPSANMTSYSQPDEDDLQFAYQDLSNFQISRNDPTSISASSTSDGRHYSSSDAAMYNAPSGSSETPMTTQSFDYHAQIPNYDYSSNIGDSYQYNPYEGPQSSQGYGEQYQVEDSSQQWPTTAAGFGSYDSTYAQEYTQPTQQHHGYNSADLNLQQDSRSENPCRIADSIAIILLIENAPVQTPPILVVEGTTRSISLTRRNRHSRAVGKPKSSQGQSSKSFAPDSSAFRSTGKSKQSMDFESHMYTMDMNSGSTKRTKTRKKRNVDEKKALKVQRLVGNCYECKFRKQKVSSLGTLSLKSHSYQLDNIV